MNWFDELLDRMNHGRTGCRVGTLLLILLAVVQASAFEPKPLRVAPGFAIESQTPLGTEWTIERLRNELCGEDPWEGFNRKMFCLDHALMTYVAAPVSDVYCSIVPRPVVRGVQNVIDNTEYPIRLFANLFRGEWGGAWDETCRFAVNTTVGVGGFFDPAKSWLDIYSTEASFSGTLARWGTPRGDTLVIPLVPRTSPRDAAGYLIDQGFDPKNYISFFFPTGIGLSWTSVLWPNYAATWIDPWESIIVPPADPYSHYVQFVTAKSLLDEDLSVYRHLNRVADGTVEPRRPPIRAEIAKPVGLVGQWRDIPGYKPRTPAVDTLRQNLFAPVRDNDFWWCRHSIFNSDFAKDVVDRAVVVSTNFPSVRYGFVPAPKEASPACRKRLVFVIPGIGGDYDSKATLAMAEIVNESGCAAVLCDDPFNWHYMLSANQGILPGNLPEDARRFAAFMKAVVDDLAADGQMSAPEVSVVGWSMGGLFTTHLAALDEREGLGFHTDAFLAVNPPVDFDSVAASVETFLAPSRTWSLDAARTNFVEIACRLAAWGTASHPRFDPSKPPLQKNGEPWEYTPDVSEENARYTVGVALVSVLPELVVARHRLHPFPSVEARPDGAKLGTCYREIGSVTVRSYMSRYLAACYPEMDARKIFDTIGLRSLESTLRGNGKLRMIHTRDDFLLTAADRGFLDSTLGTRMTWFSVGAHCGMFYTQPFIDEVRARLNLP